MPDGAFDLGQASRHADREIAEWLSGAGADAPRPMVEEGWTSKAVGEALADAMKWVIRTGRVGPGGYNHVSLPFVADLDAHLAEGWGIPELADEAEERRIFLHPTPEQITRYEAALQWPADYLLPHHPGSARALGLWAACKATRRSFSAEIKRRGTMPRSMAYALRDRGLAKIAVELQLRKNSLWT